MVRVVALSDKAVRHVVVCDLCALAAGATNLCTPVGSGRQHPLHCEAMDEHHGHLTRAVFVAQIPGMAMKGWLI